MFGVFSGIYTYMYTHIYIYMYIYIYIYVYVYHVYIYIYIYICVCVCFYTCVCIYTPHELPTVVLYRKYRIKPAFPAGPDITTKSNKAPADIMMLTSDTSKIQAFPRVFYSTHTIQTRQSNSKKSKILRIQ